MFEVCKRLLDLDDPLEELSLFFVSVDNLRARPRSELDPLFSAGHHFLELFYSSTAFAQVELRWIGLHEHKFAIDSMLYSGFVSRIRSLRRANAGVRKINVLMGYDVCKDIETAMQKADQFRYEHLSVTRPVDLIIRSGGHRRLSGFLPLMCQYAEFEFIDKLFPDVTAEDITECIRRFGGGHRKFGV
jgi:undecaprenyl diphosphate synthase